MIKQNEKYKDSKLSWMGLIPINWIITKAKYCSIFRMGQTILKEEVIEDGEFPVYSATEGDHYFGRINNPSFILEPGDIVIPARGNSIGHIALVHEKAVSTQTTIANFIDKRKVNSSFLYYFYKGFRNVLFHYDVTAIPQITIDQVKQNPIVLPPLKEQTKIAQYLDHQTSIIDQLIEQKEKLIALLKEKRQAVINEAVTKGLDQNVKMKDSGIEWLGEVPEHWILTPLKHIAILKGRLGWKGLKAEEYVESGYGFLSTPDIKNDEIDFTSINFITKERFLESPEIMLDEGDVLLVKDGSTLGITNIIKSLPFPSTVNSSIGIIRIVDKNILNPEFLLWLLRSDYIQTVINRLKAGQGVPHLFQKDIKNFLILLPNINEQLSIVNNIVMNHKIISRSVDQLLIQIEKLKEYRQSIICEAVTGKIDMRDWQPNN